MCRITFIILVFLLSTELTAQPQTNGHLENRYFIGSTFFMLANLVDDPEPPNYYQLNLGYRITPKDVVSIEVITWKYYEPIGVPLGEKKDAINFPGEIQAFGVGVTYKRFLWKRVYTQIHSTAFHQNYFDESDNKIQSGFQLFNTVRFGYQFRLFKNRMFIEPSIAWTFWPINTNLPDAFQLQEDKYPNNFFGEPGLHFGFNF